jgi:hypothetical protein
MSPFGPGRSDALPIPCSDYGIGSVSDVRVHRTAYGLAQCWFRNWNTSSAQTEEPKYPKV